MKQIEINKIAIVRSAIEAYENFYKNFNGTLSGVEDIVDKETKSLVVLNIEQLQHIAYEIIACACLDSSFQDNPEMIRKVIMDSIDEM